METNNEVIPEDILQEFNNVLSTQYEGYNPIQAANTEFRIDVSNGNRNDSTDAMQNLVNSIVEEQVAIENMQNIAALERQMDEHTEAEENQTPIVDDESLKLKENSKTAEIDSTTSRFSGASWFDYAKNIDISIAGVGGIGSWSAMIISRLKPANIVLYDPDIVESANMSGQLYRGKDLFRHKVDALTDTIAEYSDYYCIYTNKKRISQNYGGSPVFICGFDNMRARQEAFYNWTHIVDNYDKIEDKKKCLFIDGRLNAEEFQIFCMRGDDSANIERYKKEFLFDDSEVEDSVCSYKQTTYCASMIGSFICNLLVNYCTNMCDPIIEREMPFLTYYNAETMFLKVER